MALKCSAMPSLAGASRRPAAMMSVKPMAALRPAVLAPRVVGQTSIVQVMSKPAFAPSLPARRPLKIVSQAASGGAAAAPAPAQPAFKWGANMKDLAICFGIGLALWFCPAPAGVSIKAWHLVSIFIATIVGIITTPLPLGAVAVIGLGAAMLTKVLTFAEAFSAFASEIP